MKSHPTLSIIIPVFNAAIYLRACLNSIQNQEFSDYEIIAINDGSNDDSLEILTEFAAINNKIHVINQCNYGVSRARNVGIESAVGDYITFVDADDILKPTYLSNFRYTDTYGWQIQGYELNYVGQETENRLVCPKQTRECSLKEAIEEAELSRISRGPCLKLFNANVIRDNKIRFDERISYGEDAIFVKEYLLYCNPIAYCIARTDYVYNHYPSSMSLVHRYHDPRLRYVASCADYKLFYRLNERFGTFSSDVVSDFRRERALEMYNELKEALVDLRLDKDEKILFFDQVQTELFVQIQDFNNLPITYRIIRFFMKHCDAVTCVTMLSYIFSK